VPPGIPLYRSRSQQFDDLVLEAVARLEPRWETELSDVEFAVQEVPDGDLMPDGGAVPLARVLRGSSDTDSPGPRIVLFRRPLLARAEDEDELSELVFDVVVEEFAEILGVDPEIVDPGYGDIGLLGGLGGLGCLAVRALGGLGCLADWVAWRTGLAIQRVTSGSPAPPGPLVPPFTGTESLFTR
jgi:predicted Zn-dependent protease with MMP-like domain